MPILLSIGGLGCADDESQTCRDYKEALSAHAVCDPEYTTPTDLGSYAGYRCLSENEIEEAGFDESLAECTEYLEGLIQGETETGRPACEIPIAEAERQRCKDGYLAVEGEVTLSPDDVGQACRVTAVPPNGGFASDETYLDMSTGDCTYCLVEGLEGDPSDDCDPGISTCPSTEEIEDGVYCTCRCDSADSGHPTCACPDGFECRVSFERGGPGLRGSYCARSE